MGHPQAGTVTTACVTFSPRYASAVSFILIRTMALISSGVWKGQTELCRTSQATRKTHEFTCFALVVDLYGRLPTLIDDTERPVFDVALEFIVVHLTANETFGVEHGIFRVGMEGILGRVSDTGTTVS